MSTEPKDRPAPLAARALRQFIERALTRGYYRESFHAEEEHPERGISVQDVIHGLERKGWTLAAEPNYDEAHGNWEYLIRTQDLDGEELHIKIGVHLRERRFKVITKW